ncbi:hypothetical protein CSUI_002487 [Cystoisospora suis]|uniref:Uncharacterized protein n=1 Tax=Cystoisospora suis TaxID=483139 RepID=A0A2C6KTR9_9APIC|nr:hypothetical protein CSUI_002487 [Cystoisospora suis]
MWSIFAPEALTSGGGRGGSGASSQHRDVGMGSVSKRSPDGSSVSVSKQTSLEEKEFPSGSTQQVTADEKGKRPNGQKVGAKQPQNGVVSRETEVNAEDDWVEAQSKRLGKSTKVQRKQLETLGDPQTILDAVWMLTQAYPSAVPTGELLALFPPSMSPPASVGAKSQPDRQKPNRRRPPLQGEQTQSSNAPQSTSTAPSISSQQGRSLNMRDPLSGSHLHRVKNMRPDSRGRYGGPRGAGAGVRLAYVQVDRSGGGGAPKGEPSSLAPAASPNKIQPRGVGEKGDPRPLSAGPPGTHPHSKRKGGQRILGSHRPAQYEPVIRNDKRGMDEDSRAERAPQRKAVTASEKRGAAEREDVGERVRRKLREAATVEELQAAVNEARAAGLTFEAQLGEKKLNKMTALLA